MPLKAGPLQFGQSSQKPVCEIRHTSNAETLRKEPDVIFPRIVIENVLVRSLWSTNSTVAIGGKPIATILVGEI
jgi:hypothetical protein